MGRGRYFSYYNLNFPDKNHIYLFFYWLNTNIEWKFQQVFKIWIKMDKNINVKNSSKNLNISYRLFLVDSGIYFFIKFTNNKIH